MSSIGTNLEAYECYYHLSAGVALSSLGLSVQEQANLKARGKAKIYLDVLGKSLQTMGAALNLSPMIMLEMQHAKLLPHGCYFKYVQTRVPLIVGAALPILLKSIESDVETEKVKIFYRNIQKVTEIAAKTINMVAFPLLLLLPFKAASNYLSCSTNMDPNLSFFVLTFTGCLLTAGFVASNIRISK